MASLKTLHHAFTIDYPNRVKELCTSIGVSIPSLTQTFNPKKQFKSFPKGIWDTGATCTVITNKVVETLDLKPTGMANAIGVSGTSYVQTFIVDILLPNKVLVQNVNVLEGSEESFDVLIGMDIIQMGDFAISNPDGKTKFSFCLPSHSNPICLVEKSNEVNEIILGKVS